MIKKFTTGLVSLVSLSLLMVTPALAHVVVKPSQVGVAAFQTFDVSVPNEKDTPVVGVKLLIPDGLKEVSPTVKPGWKIDIKKSGTDDNSPVTEIDWTGGLIPVGQRDDFTFSAQVPASETTLNWKAYQTYQGGQIISWDQDPNFVATASGDPESHTPYSQTKIINDLDNYPAAMEPRPYQASTVPTSIAILSLILSIVALGLHLRKR